ncbi:MAG: hypothetical protein J7497_04160 [Chitinophagaceae bacterium]|nr:hypothetical protein [Chitinophagaceae bacterium]
MREQITETGYDFAYAYDPNVPALKNGIFTNTTYEPSNLRSRVSYTLTRKLATDNNYFTATHYSYDIHGNVDKLVQDYRGLTSMENTGNPLKMITYDYDLISGKVNAVHYQAGFADEFHHRYTYDAENRLLAVETTRDGAIWERDAVYQYYPHGPLTRMELGQQRVQGVDYAYTLQGWLKGVNGSATGASNFDMGQDGYGSGYNNVVARDVLGFALHYYDETTEESDVWNDYKPITGTSLFASPGSAVGLASLYNGNIAAMTVNLSA